MYSTSAPQPMDTSPPVCQSYLFDDSTSTPKQMEIYDSGYFSAKHFISPNSVKKQLSMQLNGSYSTDLDNKQGSGDHIPDYTVSTLSSFDFESLSLKKYLKNEGSPAYGATSGNSDSGLWQTPLHGKSVLTCNKVVMLHHNMDDLPEFHNERHQNGISPLQELRYLSLGSVQKTNVNLQKTVVPLSGQHMGKNFIDFLKEFSVNRNCRSVLSKILGNLTPKNLCVMSWVSRVWRRICLTHPYASVRRKQFLQQQKYKALKLGKENWYCKQKEPTNAQERSPLKKIQNVLDTSDSDNLSTRENDSLVLSPSKSRYQCFVEEAKKLKPGERLQPCPKCRSPSHVNGSQYRGNCTRISCQYDFCMRCFSAFHENKECPSIGKGVGKRNTIGSKKSRRNLRRL